MQYTILIRLIVIFLGIQIPMNLLSQDTDSLKCWSSNDRLKWSDFRGKRPEEGDLSNLSAFTGYKFIIIPLKRDALLDYRVKMIFKKYESWKIDTTGYLLKHEQLHFDIGELYARKIRRAIQGVLDRIPNPTENDFRLVIRKLYAENADMQDAYDNDTYHGIIKESQTKWERKIELELKTLDKYASTPLDCR
jgi:hypothetical protein